MTAGGHNNEQVDAVIFDMDDVLARYDRKARMAALVQLTGLDAETITARVFESGFEEAHDQGETDDAAYLAGLQERLGETVTAEAWLETRAASLTPDAAVLDMARGLKGRVPLALLTNNGSFFANRVAELFPEVPPIFDPHTYFSGSLGVGKPNTEAYLEVCRRIGSDPATTLFIDDNDGFIAGADAAGLQTHLFADAKGLAERLERLGLAQLI